MRYAKEWKKTKRTILSVILAWILIVNSGAVIHMESFAAGAEKEKEIQTNIPDLKDAVTKELGEGFTVGAAICLQEMSDELLMALVTKHFNAVTLGNELKPDAIFNYSNQTCPGTEQTTLHGKKMEVPKTNFDRAEKMLDQILEWNQEHPDETLKVRGHVLTWHSQTPEWFFHKDYDAKKAYVDKATMTQRQEWYIKTVLEHFLGEKSKYRELFYGWDVVNEAVSDSTGTYRDASEKSSWWAVYESSEYIVNAFRFANQYAPDNIELYYNDYNECDYKKSKGILQLLKEVKQAKGTRIDGMGMQGHYHTTNYPSVNEFKRAAKAYAELVNNIQVTELDFQASSDYDGTDTTYSKENVKLGYRYKAFYDAIKELCEKGVNVTNITVWGVVDKNSWLQNASFVGGGATGKKKQMPLLFDDNYQVKMSYWAFVDITKLKKEKDKIK